MHELQATYQPDFRVKITSQRSIHSGKSGIIRGVFCAGQPDQEQYVVHIDGDLDSTRVYHFLRSELEPIFPHVMETIHYR